MKRTRARANERVNRSAEIFPAVSTIKSERALESAFLLFLSKKKVWRVPSKTHKIETTNINACVYIRG